MNSLTHIVIKLSNKAYGLSSVVLRHNGTAFQYGAVWVGKPDYPLAASIIRKVNEQSSRGIKTYVFIIDPDRNNPTAYEAELQAATLKSPPDKELIPLFYKELQILHRMKAWFKVGQFHAFHLEEFPVLDEVNTSYDIQELKALKHGKRTHPGGFGFQVPEALAFDEIT